MGIRDKTCDAEEQHATLALMALAAATADARDAQHEERQALQALRTMPAANSEASTQSSAAHHPRPAAPAHVYDFWGLAAAPRAAAPRPTPPLSQATTASVRPLATPARAAAGAPLGKPCRWKGPKLLHAAAPAPAAAAASARPPPPIKKPMRIRWKGLQVLQQPSSPRSVCAV